MAEIYLTITEFEDLIQSIFCSILGWTDETLKNNVRISWPQDGAPAWDITDDMVFIRCYEIDDPYNRPRENSDEYESSPEGFVREVSYTTVMQVDLIIYGPEAPENARVLRNEIFYEENRLILAKNNVHLVFDIASPRRADEYYAGMWWKRRDMSMKFNLLTVRSTTVSAIDSVAVALYEGDAGSKIADVNINNE
jgi:hypothetical protein